MLDFVEAGLLMVGIGWGVGYGIVATGVERMASSDSLESKPTTLHETKTLHGNQGVVRAAWRESTGRGHPGKSSLVTANQKDSDFTSHCVATSFNSESTSAFSSKKPSFETRSLRTKARSSWQNETV
jgi:hypothetical protein